MAKSKKSITVAPETIKEEEKKEEKMEEKVEKKEVKKQTVAEKSGKEIAAERVEKLRVQLVADLEGLGLTYRINSEGFYMTKVSGCSVKCQMNKKVGTYKILSNERLIKLLGIEEKDYEYHKGWNVPYLIKMSLKDIVALEGKKVVQEETKTEEGK